MIFDFDFATAERTLWIFRVDMIKSLLAIWLLLVMIRVTKLILTWRFFIELKDKGIKNEQKRIVNGGGAIHGSILLILRKVGNPD